MALSVALLSTAWLLAVLTAPFLPTAFSAAVYAAGSLVCHQLPERSFHLGGFQIAVCARCLGIYGGASLGALGAVVTRLAAVPRRVRQIMVLGALPTAITVVLESAGLWPTTNIVRAAAGFPLGLVAALVVTSVLATINYRD